MMQCILCCLVSLLVISCGKADAVRNSSSAAAPSPTSQSALIQLSEIDLAHPGRIAPKGRVQDREYNQLPVVEQLIARGKESIPFLISKLDDETRIEGHVVDYWNQVYVGDVALIFLSDFFLERRRESSTIEGMKWEEFLGRGNKEITGEQLLRSYVERHGRKRIKERWKNAWEKYQERIYWDEQERAFKVRAL